MTNVNIMSCVNIKNEIKRMIFMNGDGNVIEITKTNDYCDIKLKSIHCTLHEHFKLSEFDFDKYQFEMCIQDIVNDTLADGYKRIK